MAGAHGEAENMMGRTDGMDEEVQGKTWEAFLARLGETEPEAAGLMARGEYPLPEGAHGPRDVRRLNRVMRAVQDSAQERGWDPRNRERALLAARVAGMAAAPAERELRAAALGRTGRTPGGIPTARDTALEQVREARLALEDKLGGSVSPWRAEDILEWLREAVLDLRRAAWGGGSAPGFAQLLAGRGPGLALELGDAFDRASGQGADAGGEDDRGEDGDEDGREYPVYTWTQVGGRQRAGAIFDAFRESVEGTSKRHQGRAAGRLAEAMLGPLEREAGRFRDPELDGLTGGKLVLRASTGLARGDRSGFQDRMDRAARAGERLAEIVRAAAARHSKTAQPSFQEDLQEDVQGAKQKPEEEWRDTGLT